MNFPSPEKLMAQSPNEPSEKPSPKSRGMCTSVMFWMDLFVRARKREGEVERASRSGLRTRCEDAVCEGKEEAYLTSSEALMFTAWSVGEIVA